MQPQRTMAERAAGGKHARGNRLNRRLIPVAWGRSGGEIACAQAALPTGAVSSSSVPLAWALASAPTSPIVVRRWSFVRGLGSVHPRQDRARAALFACGLVEQGVQAIADRRELEPGQHRVEAVQVDAHVIIFCAGTQSW
jgi:hypothetical protein